MGEWCQVIYFLKDCHVAAKLFNVQYSLFAGGETDQHRLETTLDMLLDYLYWGFAEKEFKQLNSYYSTIDKEGAADYQRFYDEIMEMAA